jgi:hypothetical protein
MGRISGVLSGVVVLVLAASQVGTARGGEEKRYTEAAGGFSFVPPEGWNVREFGGLKYKIVHGPAAAGFAPNINVTDETYEGTVDAYAKANQATLQRVFKNFRLVKMENFQTAGKMQGVRMIIENDQMDKKLRQTFYFFAKGNRKYVITCSALAEGGDKQDPVFEGCLKTFRFTEQ